MKSTWYLRNASDQTWSMKFINGVQAHTNAPVIERHYGKLPVGSSWSLLIRFIPPTLVGVVLQYLCHTYWRPLPLWATTLYWFVVQEVVSDWATTMFVRLGYKWGYLDGDKPRDKVPDYKLDRLAAEFIYGVIARVGLGALYLYDASAPVTLSLWFPLQLFTLTLALDFFFYAYHRATHELGTIPIFNFDAWNIHKTHHLTKHPSVSLTILADDAQEIIETVICPGLATLVTKAIFPGFNFFDWVVIMTMVGITEALGHTGIRARIEFFSTGFIFNWVLPQATLTVEDHDLHHREGWRKAANYGKQSLFWDWAFGTLRDRVESGDSNVDFSLSIFDPVPEGHTIPVSADSNPK